MPTTTTARSLEGPHVSLVHASGSRAELYQYGAQLTSWVDSTGREQCYLSRRAVMGGGKSIRGGIPVIFPQFASSGPLPKHGLIRTRDWQIVQHDAVSVTMRVADDQTSRALWPHPFLAELVTTLGREGRQDTLTSALTITNTGAALVSFYGGTPQLPARG